MGRDQKGSKGGAGGKEKPRKGNAPPRKPNGYHSANKAREERGAKPSSGRVNKLEIGFDADKRNEYLTGFSKRKKVRRQFGLAMQALKDRNEKVADRKERREEQKKAADEWAEVNRLDRMEGKGEGEADGEDEEVRREKMQFEDEQTKEMFGGEVSVSISYGVPGQDSDEEELGAGLKDMGDDDDKDLLESRQKGQKKKDEQQFYAGNVGR